MLPEDCGGASQVEGAKAVYERDRNRTGEFAAHEKEKEKEELRRKGGAYQCKGLLGRCETIRNSNRGGGPLPPHGAPREDVAYRGEVRS